MDPKFPSPSRLPEPPPPESHASPGAENGGNGGEEDGPICGICNADPQTKYLNYGAHSCFSCRAFFRRALQKTRAPTFTCQRGGRCEMNAETRRRCQRCRYDGCIRAGMVPELVLNPEQRLERFQAKVAKAVAAAGSGDGGAEAGSSGESAVPAAKRLRPDGTEKRKYVRRKKTSSESTAAAAESPNPLRVAQTHDFSVERSMLRIHGGSHDGNTTNNAITNRPSTPSNVTTTSTETSTSTTSSRMRNESTKPGGKFKTKMMMMYAREEQEAQLKSVQLAADGSLARLESGGGGHDVYAVPPPDKQVDRRLLLHKTMSSNITWKTTLKRFAEQARLAAGTFLSFHGDNGGQEWMDKGFFRSHVRVLRDLLPAYAEKYPDYGLLTENDKAVLLGHNAGMVVAFILAKYWGSIITREQLQWILFDSVPLGEVTNSSSVATGSFNTFAHELSFAFSAYHVGRINDLVQKVVGGSGHVEWTSAHAVAHACLFHVDAFNFSLLDSPELIQRISWESSLILYQKNSNHAELHELKTSLRELSVLLMQNANFCPDSFAFGLATSLLPPTQDTWLAGEIARVDESFLAVSYGEEVVADFAAVSSGEKPFSRQFLGNVCSVYAERSRGLLKEYPEFAALADKDQMAMWMASIVPVFACVLGNVEAGETLLEQATFMATQEDRKVLVARIRDIPRERLRPVKLRPSRVLKLCKTNGPRWRTIGG